MASPMPWAAPVMIAVLLARHDAASGRQSASVGCGAVLGPDRDDGGPRACRGDDATNEHYSMFFCDEEGTQSRWRGVREVIERQDLFCSLYTDRGSHYWHTPEAGGKVDKANLTPFGRAMAQRGIEMIPAYSPEARGRSERVQQRHQKWTIYWLQNRASLFVANRYFGLNRAGGAGGKVCRGGCRLPLCRLLKGL